MILNLNSLPITVLLPNNSSGQIESSYTATPFSEQLIKELSELGSFLMTKGRAVPSIVAAGYWLRKSHLLAIKSQYPTQQLQAKGTVFHIAPGNVDTLFFYSMIISVLCGNQTVLRVSNKLSVDTLRLLDLMNQFFIESGCNTLITSLITVIQYDHDDAITAKISSASASRVIWGSDETIETISQFSLNTDTCNNANNICFPDRYSVAVIQLDNESQLKGAVENLLRDIKPYFQQACSSPKVVYWLNTAQHLQDEFWTLIAKQLSEQESLEAPDLISQLVYVQQLSLLLGAGNIDKNKRLLKRYGLLQVAEVESITFDSIKSHCGLWVLLSQQINELEEIKLFEHCQTVTMSGVESLLWQCWQKTTQQSMKRIVPAGQALAFSHIWDGIDLVDVLTR